MRARSAIARSAAAVICAAVLADAFPRCAAAEPLQSLASAVQPARFLRSGNGCPDPNCPGCRAFYDSCNLPCPPAGETYYGPGGAPGAEGGEFGEPGADTLAPPQTGEPGGVNFGQTPLPSAMSGGMGAVAASTSAAPSMIGDFFGGGYRYGPALNSANVSRAGSDRFLKYAENNSPFPQDRVFYNFNHFHNALVDVNGSNKNVDRLVMGVEKTVLDGTASVEFRLPFASTLDSTQQQSSGTTETELGNLSLSSKVLLYDNCGVSVAGGIAMVFPTGNDSAVLNSVGERQIFYANDSYYLQPFLGVFMRHNPRLFSQGFVQVTFDLNGNYVSIPDGSVFGTSASDRLRDQTVLFLDYSVGYWLHRSQCRNDFIRGVAPMLELHYSTALENQDLGVFGDTSSFSSPVFQSDNQRDILNLTTGVYFDLRRNMGLKMAAVSPLREGTDRLFDAEFGLQLIHRY